MSLNETLTASPSPFLVKIAQEQVPNEIWILLGIFMVAFAASMLYSIYMNKDDKATIKITKMVNNNYMIKYSFNKGDSIGRLDNIRKKDVNPSIENILELWL